MLLFRFGVDERTSLPSGVFGRILASGDGQAARRLWPAFIKPPVLLFMVSPYR